MSAKHTIIVSLTGFGVTAGLFVWVVQLAREGEPIGYIILTALGAMAFLVTGAIVLFLLIWGVGKREQAAFSANARENAIIVNQVQRTMNEQNKALLYLLTQVQRNPAVLSDPSQNLTLGPGVTIDGFVIDQAAFDVLDEE